MFSAIKNFFTKVGQLTADFFENSEVIEEENVLPTNGFLQSEIIKSEPKIKTIKRLKTQTK
jgi:hypothetical protein